MSDIKNYRTDYEKHVLNRKDLHENPIQLFDAWLQDAMNTIEKDANAFTLSTIDVNSFPSSRVLLLKEVSNDGFVFFTNYNSHKGKEMEVNPKVALNFFWPSLERQVRIQGEVKKLTKDESDAYFKSRPYKSQIAAWASEQSSVLKSRSSLEERYSLFSKKYPDHVPRPTHWGGFLVKPQKIEFWQGRSSRLHDRFCFIYSEGKWTARRLAP